VWQGLPEFRQVLTNPGEQLPRDASSDLMTAGIFFAMQVSFWVRLLRIPDSVRRLNVFLNHCFCFSPPQLYFWQRVILRCCFQASSGARRETDFVLVVQHGFLFIGCLFALFCTSLEVERLGQAFRGNRN